MSGAGDLRRSPVVCGALGGYDPELVRDVGRRMTGELSVVHEDGDSILLLDRPPIRWRGRGRGLAWSENPHSDRPVRFWKDASRELAACGLVVQGERRRVHSSVSGVAPIYHLAHGNAVYFASRIDPLVRALPRRLTIDWRAWASIFYLRFPLGERTPFLEIKRLRPFSTLEWDDGGQRPSTVQHRWPWSEVEPQPRSRGWLRCHAGGDAGGDRAARGRSRDLHPERRLGLPSAALPPGAAGPRRSKRSR